MLYKIVNKLIRINFDDFFMTIPTSHDTRGHQLKIYKRHATKRPRIEVFSQRVISDWNSLPSIVVTATSVNNFKNKLDQHWKDRRFYTRFEYN